MFRFSFMLIAALALAGCGSDAPSSAPEAAVKAAGFTVADAGSGALDERLALRVRFSEPLDASQQIDGYLDLGDAEGNPLQDRWVLAEDRATVFYPGVEAETRYQLDVSPGLKAASGETLERRYQQTVLIGSVEPSARFASRGSVLLRDLRAGLPIRTTNVAQVDVEFFRVRADKYGEFFGRFAEGGLRYTWALGDLNQMSRSIYMHRFDTHGEPNVAAVSHLPVQSIKELGEPGLYLAVMRPAGSLTDNYDTQLFAISDIALHARRFDRSTAVFVSRLSNGAALAGADVYLVSRAGERRALRTSDASGFAELAGPTRNDDLLVVEKGADAAYLHLGDPALDLSRYAVDGPAWRPTRIFAWSPRDLYRPGNELIASLLVRDDDGRLTSLRSVSYRLTRPDGRDAARGTVEVDALGFADLTFGTAPHDPTGRWSLELRADPTSENADLIHVFKVQEFLPERLAVELDAESTVLVGAGTYPVEVEGRFLYGAPAAGNTVTLEVATAPLRQAAPDALPEFEFGPLHAAIDPETRSLDDAVLDDNGKVTVQVDAPGRHYPYISRLYAAVLERGGRGVERAVARRVWPVARMPGLRPLFEDGQVSVRNDAAFELVLAEAGGTAIGDKELDLTLIREDREYFWTFDEYEGWSSTYSERRVTVREESQITAADPVTVSYQLEPGWYILRAHDAETGFTTELAFTVGNMWQASGATAVVPDRAVIELDRPHYKIGDTIEATLVSPHQGHAIVTLEADQVVWRQRMEVEPGATTFSLALNDDTWQRHDLFLTALVARPANASARTTPQRAIGIAPVVLDRTERELAVDLAAPGEVRPLESLEVEVAVPGAAGQQAAVTVAAVDQGILNITGFDTPDPMASIFEHRAYAPTMQDLYHRVIEQLGARAATPSYGGDMDIGRRAGVEAEVKLLSLYSGPVSMDANGRATVRLDVPDFTGAIKIMAVAFTADRFGAADATVLARAPVTATLSLPRFLAFGDEAQAVLELHNLTDEDRSVQLAWTLDNLHAELPTSDVMLGAGERKQLPITIQPATSFGLGQLILTAQSGDYAYRQDRELQIRPAYPDERRAFWKEIPAGTAAALNPEWTQGLMTDSQIVRVTASARPPLGLADAADGLLHYPYGCLEQTLSSAYPWLLLTPENQRALGVEVRFPTKMVPATAAQRAFAKLLSMQRTDGYLVLWESAQAPARLISAYAAEYLLDAREQGYEPPAGMLEQLNTALVAGLSTGAWNFDSPEAHFAYLAYAAKVLAEQGEINLSSVRGIRERFAASAGSGLDLARLAVALQLAGASNEASALFARALVKKRDRGYWQDYGTELRDDAMILALALEHGLHVADFAPRLREVAAEVVNRRWLSTQERIALLRLGVAMGPVDETMPLALEGAGAIDRESRGTLAAALEGVALNGDMAIRNDGQSVAYLMVDAVGFPLEPPARRSDPFRIEQRLYRADGARLTDGRFEQGEVYFQHIAVTSALATRNALLVAMLPAGLELENPDLGGRAVESFREQLDVDEWSGNEQSLLHAEYRDDRFVGALDLDQGETYHAVMALRAVTPGRFVMPPVIVEDMYRPEQRGISAVAFKAIEVAPRGAR